MGSYRHYFSRRSLCQTEKVCESIYFLNVILIFFPMVLDRFNFMTPPLSLFYVFILLFCRFISLAVKVLSSWFMQLWRKFCDFLSAVIFWNMLWSTLLSVMLRVLWVLARIVFISYLVLYIFLFPLFVRWFSKKLVFLLFYNADIIPVSKFLYFLFSFNRVASVCQCYWRYYNLEINSHGSPASPHVFPTNPPGAYIYIHAS